MQFCFRQAPNNAHQLFKSSFSAMPFTNVWSGRRNNGTICYMEVVLRREDGAERQVIEIGQIDLMARLHVAQQLRRQNQPEENVDRQQEDEVRKALA